MTPFGERLRVLRRRRGVTQRQMAAALGISNAYLSALEHGHRGRPTFDLLHRIIGYLGVIWDEAEELQRLADISHPRVTVDTSGLSANATRLANRLAETIPVMGEEDVTAIIAIIEAAAERDKERRRRVPIK